VVYVAEHREARGRPGGELDPVAAVAAEARRRGVEVAVRARVELDALAGADARHQGVVAIAGDYRYADVDELLDAAAARGEPPLIVALDGVQDPHNLGAIVRSAYVLGAHGVIVPRDRAAAVTPVVTKVSAGATERIGVAQVTNLVRTLEQLKARDVWVAAVAAEPDARPLWALDARAPLALVLGSEGSGVRRLVRKVCDFAAAIPMAGAGVGSLNVSVAAGAALYEVARQRRSAAPVEGSER
jgi:23S rRNA (guanosine2251-2'-O)-methyltransferase